MCIRDSFIWLSTRWRSFSFSLQVRQDQPWCDWSIPHFTGSRQYDGCDSTKRWLYRVHKYLSSSTLLMLRFFSCSVRFKVSSECLIVEVFLVTGFSLISWLSSSFIPTDVHFCQCVHSHRSSWGAECAELGIPSITGFQRQIGIWTQQDSYITTWMNDRHTRD